MPPKKTYISKTVSKSDVIELPCEWESCTAVFKSLDQYSAHVTDHLTSYNNSVQRWIAFTSQQGGLIYARMENSDTNNDDSPLYACYWRECNRDPFDDFTKLKRHVYFHVYHTRIKSIGAVYATKNSLGECHVDPISRNLIPDLPDGLFCNWEHCQLTFDNPDTFYSHMANHCDVYPSGNHVAGGCRCHWEGCKTVVKSKHRLKEHVRSHTQEKLAGCPTCGTLFSNFSRCYDHRKRQEESDVQSYQCSHCNKRYASERLLKGHMRHHVNYYQCLYCDMTCSNPSNLKLHMKYRHSEMRPFVCEECSHMAKSLSDLNRHRETHRAWIYCSEKDCTFRCHSATDLSRHSRLKHEYEGGKDTCLMFLCHICGLRYTKANNLTSHLKTKHKFSWPQGHVRFKYMYHDDGCYRLQTVRYESIELTRQVMIADSAENHDAATSAANKTDANRPPDIYDDLVIGENNPQKEHPPDVNYSYNLDLLGDVALKDSDVAKKQKKASKVSDKKVAKRKKKVVAMKENKKRRRSSSEKSTSVLQPPPDDQTVEKTLTLPNGQTVLVSSDVNIDHAIPESHGVLLSIGPSDILPSSHSDILDLNSCGRVQCTAVPNSGELFYTEQSSQPTTTDGQLITLQTVVFDDHENFPAESSCNSLRFSPSQQNSEPSDSDSDLDPEIDKELKAAVENLDC